MNKIILIGNLTKDVEFTTTNNGTYVSKFTLAVARRFCNQDGERETDFINCVAWKTTAENLNKYCKKGSKVGIVGRLEIRSYEKDGQKRYIAEVIVEELEFLSTNKEEKTKDVELTPVDDDSLPF